MEHKKWSRGLSMIAAVCLALSPLQAAKAEAARETVVIDEIESTDADGGNDRVEEPEQNAALVINEINSSPDDWVELMNLGQAELDLTGFELRDNSDDHRWQFPTGTTLAAGELLLVKADSAGLVYDDQTDTFVEGVFDEAIGIGSGDSIRMYDRAGQLLDSHSWTEHANVHGDESASWGRYPDGTGDFVLMPETPGAANDIYAPDVETNGVVLNEVQSNDPAGGPDWIELANPTDTELDISGILIRDDDDSHGYVIPEGTVIPAGGFLVITSDTFGFGLGKDDAVRLFEGELLIASTTWPGHTDPTWGLYPDIHGDEYQATAEATPGAANAFVGIPEAQSWPGDQSIAPSELSFLEDSSGLDFYDGKLYAVDNGTGKFWILDVSADGTLSFPQGFENGKTVNFASRGSAKGPDTEGITVDGDGYVYLASERDNSDKGTNYNVILMVDPYGEGDALTAMREWDLTASLPDVAANTGIEAVEWVANDELAGKLFDRNTGVAFDPANYPDAVAGGVFFVALEDNGHVYAYILNADGSSVQIEDLDPELGGAMALDYDTYEHQLWVVADDGFGNMAAKLTFTGDAAPQIVHVAPPSGLDVGLNNEGFAIADAGYTVDGQRPVYRFTDGVTAGALTIGHIDCGYVAHTHSFTNYVSNGDATCVADGTKTAKCDGCDETDTMVDVGSRKSHTYEDGKCIDCGAEDPDFELIPVTGDRMDAFLWGAALMLSMAGLIVTIVCDMKEQRR